MAESGELHPSVQDSVHTAVRALRSDLEHLILGAEIGPFTCGAVRRAASTAVQIAAPTDSAQLGRWSAWRVVMREKNNTTTFTVRLRVFVPPGFLVAMFRSPYGERLCGYLMECSVATRGARYVSVSVSNGTGFAYGCSYRNAGIMHRASSSTALPARLDWSHTAYRRLVRCGRIQRVMVW